jgi:hypothetical protein
MRGDVPLRHGRHSEVPPNGDAGIDPDADVAAYVWGRATALPRRASRVRDLPWYRPSMTKGAGKAGYPLIPMVRVQQKARGRTTGSANNRPSLRNGFTAYTCSPWGPAFLPPSCATLVKASRAWHQHRDAGTTRLHRPQCAVRRRAISPLRHHRVHRIPTPTLVTIAWRPSSSRRDVRKCAVDLPDAASGIFRARNLATTKSLMRRDKLVVARG